MNSYHIETVLESISTVSMTSRITKLQLRECTCGIMVLAVLNVLYSNSLARFWSGISFRGGGEGASPPPPPPHLELGVATFYA